MKKIYVKNRKENKVPFILKATVLLSVDFLSLDEEFWEDGSFNAVYNDFLTIHFPILYNMYTVSQSCSPYNLRVEDYVGTPLDPWAATASDDTDFTGFDKYTAKEVDTIGEYADRILLSSYTEYSTVLWNRPDFIQIDSLLGRNWKNAYYKKEVWPVFSAENYDYGSHTCIGDGGDGDDFSGTTLWMNNKEDTADWIEQQYFDSLSSSENNLPIPVFTNGWCTSCSETPTPMWSTSNLYPPDTDFQILGDMWFYYGCLSDEPLMFDTASNGLHKKGYLDFYVTLGPDTQWTPANTSPIVITAKPHGGVPPYTYTWYNLDNGRIVFYSTSANTYPVEYNSLAKNYEVSKLGVVVKDANATVHDTNVTDYICIYEQYTGLPMDKPVRRQGNSDTQSVAEYLLDGVKVYPNPNTGQFTVSSVTSNDGSSKYMEIYTMLGQKIFSQTLLNINGDNIINLNTEADGIYFYRVISENGKLIGEGKLIIEK